MRRNLTSMISKKKNKRPLNSEGKPMSDEEMLAEAMAFLKGKKPEDLFPHKFKSDFQNQEKSL